MTGRFMVGYLLLLNNNLYFTIIMHFDNNNRKEGLDKFELFWIH
jgi:hypothetical protein